jgi:hypothetical protein
VIYRKQRLAAVVAAVVVLLGLSASSIQAQQPDSRGELVTRSDTHQGVKASAPIPPSQHIQNEGGSDGAGLCVIASILANGQYQQVPGLEGAKQSQLWRTAKQRPGGYAPQKLANLVESIHPDETWASYVGRDTSVLDALSRKGYPIGATMNTGALYNYRPIHHMVSLVHYRQGEWACVVDNNRPGYYSWMPAQEFDRRWIDGSTGWAWVWTRLPMLAGVSVLPLVILIAAAVTIVIGKRRESESFA